MFKLHLPSLSVKPILKRKAKQSVKGKRVSNKCFAVVVLDNGVYKARVKNKIQDAKEMLIIPFTEDTFDLHGKTHVFELNRDKNGKRVLHIRDAVRCEYIPGSSSQYKVLDEGILVVGHIVNYENKLLFHYDDFVAFTEFGPHINETKVSENSVISIL